MPVDCHPALFVGDCVPFYFCPRSVMLYVIYRGNHPELAYKAGQDNVLHFELDLHEVAAWADQKNHRWAFSTSNAGAYYAEFRAQLNQLADIDWTAVAARDFRPSGIQEGKQAEFLVERHIPWRLVSRIGVISAGMKKHVDAVSEAAEHRPLVEVRQVGTIDQGGDQP